MTIHHSDLIEFVDAVADMRVHQRVFFRSPAGSAARHGALRAAREAERKVDQMLADINCDGYVNAFDIDPFVQCLTGGGCPACP